MHLKTSLHFEKGFTLVETLVAITILLVVVLGPMTIAQKGLQNAYTANEQMTAVFIAQEAIELVRAVRDNQAIKVYKDTTDTLRTNTWFSALGCTSGGTGGTYSCNVDVDGAEGVPEPYTRTVTIAPSSGSWTIEADVEWNHSGVTKNVTIKTVLYDQYKRYED